MRYKLLIQYFGGRGASKDKWETGKDGDRRNGGAESTNDFVSRVNRLADGRKMSFDIMLNNFRESFTTNDEKGKDGRVLSSYEHLIGIDEEGFAHVLKHGGSDSVGYGHGELAGLMVIHNHPNDTSFSRADLRGLEEDKIKGIVASGKSGDYIFKIGKNFKYKEFDKALSRSPITDEVTPRKGETGEQALARVSRYTNQWLGQNAKKYGYTFEHRKAKKLKAKDKIS